MEVLTFMLLSTSSAEQAPTKRQLDESMSHTRCQLSNDDFVKIISFLNSLQVMASMPWPSIDALFVFSINNKQT